MDKSRQQFEEWFAPQKEEMKRNGLGMISITRMHQRQLSAWKASRESLEIELPEPFIANETWCYDEDLVNQALISNGVKIKNE
ncbi:hypothetical protein IMQ36_11195 [Providencia rettgeri]|nr:hypothetical protein [Providencia rettgeri]QPE15772.1 hypothetical protein IMQ36_11195 [Providencia rettgeri]